MRRSRAALMLAVVVTIAVVVLLVCRWQRRDAGPDGARAPVTVADMSDADILFLEALRRGYALDDLVVRRELVRRMRDTLLQEHATPEPDDAELTAYLARHADRYRAPARYSFDQVYLSRGRHGDALQATADAVAARLRTAPESYPRLGDPFPRAAHLEGLNVTQIEADFGYAVAKAVAAQAAGSWQGPVTSPLGLHFLRVTQVEPGHVLPLDAIRQRVRSDYINEQQQGVIRAALRRLRSDFADAPPLPHPAPVTDEEIP